MSALYGSVQGTRGEATRCGHREMTAHVRGWNAGVRIVAEHGQNGKDRFFVYRTAGSNGVSGGVLIAVVDENDDAATA